MPISFTGRAKEIVAPHVYRFQDEARQMIGEKPWEMPASGTQERKDGRSARLISMRRSWRWH